VLFFPLHVRRSLSFLGDDTFCFETPINSRNEFGIVAFAIDRLHSRDDSILYKYLRVRERDCTEGINWNKTERTQRIFINTTKKEKNNQRTNNKSS
jgi:hypothetical protein